MCSTGRLRSTDALECSPRTGVLPGRLRAQALRLVVALAELSLDDAA